MAKAKFERTSRMFAAIAFCIGIIAAPLAIVAPSIATAQEAVVVAPDADVTTLNEVVSDDVVDLSVIVDDVIGPVVLAAVGVIATVLGTALFGWLKRKFNIDVSAGHRKTLQDALENAAGLLVAKMREKAVVTIDNDLLRTATSYVARGAPDALKFFNLGPEAIREKVEAHLGKMLGLPAPEPVVVTPVVGAPVELPPGDPRGH